MNKRFTLKQYSTAAAVLLAPAAAFSQAVYTDIDPDVILDEPGETFGIDLDEDGLNDFNFFNKSFTTTVFYMDLANVKALFVGAFDSAENGIVGNYVTFSGGYFYNRPYAMLINEQIDSSVQFFNDNYQTMAKEIDKFYSPFENTHVGNWFTWGSNILNHYIGFRFSDIEYVKRYGWIRCSVIDSGRTLIIHDYAYESKPETPILTGDTIGDTTTVSIQEGEFSGLTVYSFGNSVFISTPLNDIQYRILNLQGELILNGRVTSGSYKLDLNTAASGIYLVECHQEEMRKTFKIFIEN